MVASIIIIIINNNPCIAFITFLKVHNIQRRFDPIEDYQILHALVVSQPNPIPHP